MMDWLTHTPVPVIELEAKICRRHGFDGFDYCLPQKDPFL